VTSASSAAFLTIRITPELKDALQKVAAQNFRTMSDEAKMAIQLHVDRQEEK
jgi:predicted transcriptional regulator